MLAVLPMLIVPRRVFVRKCLKPRKVKVAGLIAGRLFPCNRLPSGAEFSWTAHYVTGWEGKNYSITVE